MRDAKATEMSQYLQHLAARAQGQLKVAKPRLTPLFGDMALGPIDGGLTRAIDEPTTLLEREPESGVAHEALPQAASTDKTQDSPRCANPSDRPHVAVPDRRAAAAPIPPFDAEPAVNPLPRARTPVMAESSPASLPPSSPGDETAPRDDRPAIVNENHREPPSRAVAASVAAPMSAHATDLRPARMMPRSGLDPSPEIAADPLIHTQPIAATWTRETPRRVDDARESIALGAGVSPPAPPVADAHDRRITRVVAPMSSITERSGGRPSILPLAAQPQRRPEATPTTINVTIGRVEVRATAQAQPEAKPKRASPSPTNLEQYLLRRSRGSVT